MEELRYHGLGQVRDVCRVLVVEEARLASRTYLHLFLDLGEEVNHVLFVRRRVAMKDWLLQAVAYRSKDGRRVAIRVNRVRLVAVEAGPRLL